MSSGTEQLTVSAEFFPAPELRVTCSTLVTQTRIVTTPDEAFDTARHLYSERPLRVKGELTKEQVAAFEDAVDASDSQRALQESPGVSVESLRKELGV